MDILSTVSAYVVVGVIVIVLLYFIVKALKNRYLIIINSIFGGALFLIFNIVNMQLPINALTIGFTALLGVPGVLILVFMKFVLGVL